MPQGLFVYFPLELRHGHARADLLLQGVAPGGGVHNALDVDFLHFLADAGEKQRQGVHDEAGIDPRPQDGDPFFHRQQMDPFRHDRVFRRREEQFFTGGDDVDLFFEDILELLVDGRDPRTGGVDHHVGLDVGQEFPGLVTDRYPQRRRQLQQFPQILSRQARVGIHGADDGQRLLFENGPDRFQADVSQTVLNDPNLSLFCKMSLHSQPYLVRFAVESDSTPLFYSVPRPADSPLAGP